MPRRPTGRPPGRPRHPEPLTPAEQRVLQHLREKLPNAEIGVRLGVSPDAVKYHISNMLGKLGLENREQLAAWRETSGLRRLWAGTAGLGWKLAIGGGVVAASVVAVAVVWGLTRDETEEPSRFDPEALAVGVLTVGIDGQAANGNSTAPSISADGRYIAFESDATNLVKDDSNGHRDIFLIDRLTNETRRISMGMGGAEPNGPSFRPSISADGKWVAFDSQASNLVKDDDNAEFDRALAHVPENMREQLTDPNSGGQQRFGELFLSWAGSDVFVNELATERTEIVSVTSSEERGVLGSYAPAISGDGRFVAFESSAPNLAGTDRARDAPPVHIGPSQFAADVFIRDRDKGTTTRISTKNDGSSPHWSSGAASITPDARFVSFVSRDPDLVGPRERQTTSAYVWTRSSGKLGLVPDPQFSANHAIQNVFVMEISRVALSTDGRFLAYSGGFSLFGPDRTTTELRGCFVADVADDAATRLDTTNGMCGSGLPQVVVFDGHTVLLPTDIDRPGAMEAFDLDTKTSTEVALPAGVTSALFPSVSSRKGGGVTWVAGVELRTVASAPSGLPVSQIVVFPR